MIETLRCAKRRRNKYNFISSLVWEIDQLCTVSWGMQIVIPFAQVNAFNPNMPEMAFEENVAKYFRCISVACHSFRYHNPGIRIVVITNAKIEEEFSRIFTHLNVEIISTPFTYDPPREFGLNFRGCFYLFDAIRTLSEDSLIVDPDVICLENLNPMISKLGSRISVFKPGFSSRQVVNGISPSSAALVFEEYSKKTFVSEPEHVGGEVIYLPREMIEKLSVEIKLFWNWNILRARQGMRFLTTEEHILTALLRDYQCDSLASFVSRIWTTRKFKEVEGEIKDINKLLLWHLPSEKNTGFQSVYHSLFDTDLKNNPELYDRKHYRKIMHIELNLLQRSIYSLIRSLKIAPHLRYRKN